MKSLKDTIHQREMSRTGGTPESADFHSKGYHQYFEGYSEYTELDSKGRPHIKRVYTGIYHTQLLSVSQQNWLRITYTLLVVFSILLFLYAATRYVPSNSKLYIAVFEILSVLGFLWIIWSLFNYISAGRKMTLGEYRSVQSLKTSSKYTSVTLVLTAAITIFYTIFHLETNIMNELLCSVMFFASAAFIFSIGFLESRITYDSFLSNETVPVESNQIS